jgi:hypothetical protein
MLDLRHVLFSDHPDIARFATKLGAVALARSRGWNACDVMRAFNNFQVFWIVGERLPDSLRVATRAPGTVRLPYHPSIQ